MNFDELEKFRTKEELVKYFEEKGKNITEEEIEALKKRYEETEKRTEVLSLEQLDEIAGGVDVCRTEANAQVNRVARSINLHRSRDKFLIGDTVAVEYTFNGVDKVAFIYDSRSSKVSDYELEPASVSLYKREHDGQIDAAGIIKGSGKSFDFKGFSPKDFGGANCSTIEVEFENTENTLSAMDLTTTVLGDEYREILSALKENSVLYNKARSMPGFAELEKMLETPKNTKVLRLY